MPDQLTLQLIQSALPGQWHRTDGVLSMYIFAPVIAGQKSPVEFNVPAEQGNATSTWDYEVVQNAGGFWLHLTNRTAQSVQIYRIGFLEKNNSLRLHADGGYDLIFNAKPNPS